jgi:cellulose synthase/poly-beta-1,6-N-acetylglucosamine synthase-like glycosyltransferase/spore germination protein YaaH/peptidoglycan/xylan/chitin deacetylase (PgdA/CDA1 family)
MPTPVFYDPERKRWKRLRRTADVFVVAMSLLVVFFAITVFHGTSIPKILLADQKKNYRALEEKEVKHPRKLGTHRLTNLPPSKVVLNSSEGIRGAFYVTWDAASYSSLREYIHQIDFVFPEWLHVLTPDGRLQAATELNTLFPAIGPNGKAETVDQKLMPLLKKENAQTDVFPLVNNFDPITNVWREDVGRFLRDPKGRARFRREVGIFLASDRYKGLTLDLEAIPPEDQAGYRTLLSELSSDLHARGQKLYVSVPLNNPDYDYPYIAKQADGLILMNYDQHYPGGAPGSVAGQDWFTKNLESALKVIPREKIICALASYGYDWSTAPKGKPGQAGVHNVSVQEAWIEARDSEAPITFDPESLNPHFTYLDEQNLRHDVWYLDAVTALNQMRAAKALGISTFALWRLGSEDRSLWQVWDNPLASDAPSKLQNVQPGQDTDMEGDGEIVRIETQPTNGHRDYSYDPHSSLIVDEHFTSLPTPYRIAMYGAVGKKIAISFDDGPDPKWTPQILDILKKKNVKGLFFLIGLEAEKYPGLTKRVYEEGHEIGNHTFTHPDISAISRSYMQVELNLTERFFAGRLGMKPIFFRPPYSIDQEPDTADEVRPLQYTQDMGYITVGDKIDPDDWHDNPRQSADQLVNSVIAQLGHGNVILLHDGGGDRSETVKALPRIIDELRARGYELVPASDLIGMTRDQVMPPIAPGERAWAKVDDVGFIVFGAINTFIVLVFFIGDILMTGRLVLVGTLAIFDRLRRRNFTAEEIASYQPRVAVLVPAYNEEKVIERTVRSVLDSDYPHLRVIVIDDGSTDRTFEVSQSLFAAEIAEGKVLVITQENGGKAKALNHALTFVDEEIYVGIDADTLIAPDAIGRLVTHFRDPKIGALAGNAKVGNRVNLWTRWQALEYITSQNFERRALNAFACVCVVPGAIGAWRTEAVRAAGFYKSDTVAEDADLTMALLQAGYRVEYEDRALAYTEAPTTAGTLMRQRFRWSFGILQASFKHRSAFWHGNALGLVALPNIVIFQIMLPLVSPFIDLMFVVGTLKYLIWDKHFHPETADPASFQQLLLFFLMFMVIDFIASTIAFSLERKHPGRGQDWWLLGHVWLQRFAYRQVFAIVLFKTIWRAAEGKSFNWDKLERTNTVNARMTGKKTT